MRQIQYSARYEERALYEARPVALLTSSVLFPREGRIGTGVGHDLIVHGLVGAFFWVIFAFRNQRRIHIAVRALFDTVGRYLDVPVLLARSTRVGTFNGIGRFLRRVIGHGFLAEKEMKYVPRGYPWGRIVGQHWLCRVRGEEIDIEGRHRFELDIHRGNRSN